MSKLNYLTTEDVSEILSIAREYKSLPSVQKINFSNLGDIDMESLEISCEINSRLTKRIELLSQEAIAELSALAWLGRGDEGNFDSILAYAKSNPGTPSYLAGKAPLADYLENGLTQIYNS